MSPHRARQWGTFDLLLVAFRAVAVVAVMLCLAPSAAHAQTTDAHVLFVEMAGDREDLAALQAVLRDVLSGLKVDQRVEIVPRIDASTAILAPAAGSGGASALLGRAFLDLSSPTRATVYLVDAKWERILVRHVPRAASAEIVRETVGRIVSTGVEALLAGSFGEVSRPVERSAAPRPPPPTTAPPAMVATAQEPRRALRSRIGLMYEATLYSRAKPLAHGPALAGATEIGDHPLKPAFWITAQYRFPIIESDSPIGLRLDTTAARLLGGVALDVTSRLTLEMGVGPGLDIMHLAPRLTGGSDVAWTTDARWIALGLARAMLGIRWQGAIPLSVQAALVVDIDVSGSRFTVDQDSGRVPVIAPYPLRPGLALTISAP